MDHRRFPYESIPSGWYQVAWSDELAPGAIVPLHYFDEDLVLFRDADGTVRLFDAFCPHLGAHLGYGGTVDGETIICPYHGWRFDGQGRNCEIPYADGPNRTRIRSWPVVETGSLILAWYGPAATGASWDPLSIPGHSSGDYVSHPLMRRTWQSVRLKPQFIAENLVDAVHQKFVHRSFEIPDITSYSTDGPVFRVDSTIVFGQGKAATWLTPDGKPLAASLRTESWGLGIAMARFDIDDSIHVQCTTPVDGERSDSRATVLVPPRDLIDGQPTEDAIRRFEHECKQFERDLPIWEHLRYTYPTPFPRLELDRFRTFRNWSAQFYPEADPDNFGQLRDRTSG